ncbi:MAG TPA: hypothetical protein VIR77_04445 [Pontiella sp.]
MFLKYKPTEDLVEVLSLPDVTNPYCPTIRARSYEDESIQRPRKYLKTDLTFPSGEPLPSCWLMTHQQRNAA